jgi:hypothetical protein
MQGKPASGGLGLLFATRAEGALAVVAGGFERHRFGVSQQDQFVHRRLRVGMRWRECQRRWLQA